MRPPSRIWGDNLNQDNGQVQYISSSPIHGPEKHTLRRCSSDECIDNTAELLTAKSRLRSITERKQSEEDAPYMTMDQLGNMLDDTIVQQTTVTANHLVPELDDRHGDRQSDQVNDGGRSKQSPLYMDQSGTPAQVTAEIEMSPSRQEPTSLLKSGPTWLAPVPKTMPLIQNPDTVRRRDSVFRRYSSRNGQQTIQDHRQGGKAAILEQLSNTSNREDVQVWTQNHRPGQNEPSGTPSPRSARSSMVESRIQELMSASKQSSTSLHSSRRSTIDQGRVKQRVMLESAIGEDGIDSKTVPFLQVPIIEQAEALSEVTGPDDEFAPTIPTETTKTSDSTGEITSPKSPLSSGFRVASPTRRNNATPVTTPTRGRSKKVKQSLSPRGVPYAIEQRFNLSPSRSRSRHSNGVFVSVEVKRSPERNGAAGDEHEVIIRASVEPEDIVEDP